ncbi:sporulation integral membrane protein YlbJ [Clostridium lundense]|uniref:sporulation integral membrane protein YlbJ n=1 Tax=Clostridium lundense TaxID=319475 RepID=UPI0004889AA8|nr:sporulation integral membrane protein YlbJ [Clostridium lundense]
MKTLLYILIIATFILLLILLKDKSLIITIVCSLIIISFVLNPMVCIKGCISGASLFFYKVFPSLFPFLIVCNIILYCNGVYIYSKALGKILCYPLGLPLNCSFALVVSILCGYPLGAKYSCDLYEKGVIDYETCKRLLNIASNPSPLFIIGSVGTSMLGNTKIGYILLLASYISCIIMGFILPRGNTKIKFNNKKSTLVTQNINLGNILKDSIENGIKTALSVGGFIVLFSVLNNIIKHSSAFYAILNILKIPKTLSEGFILGFIEMTNGCNIISSSNVNFEVKLLTIGFLLGFSGLCIIWQCNSFMSKHNFSLITYGKNKVLQGLICSIVSYILYLLLYNNSVIGTFASNISINYNINFIFIIAIFILFILPIIVYNLKKHIL